MGGFSGSSSSRGIPPTPREVKNSRYEATSPGWTAAAAHSSVDGFAVFGGKPSAERIERTGRVDVRDLPGEPG